MELITEFAQPMGCPMKCVGSSDLFEHFNSNPVGDPFGPQSHGALCMKSKTCWSISFNLPFFLELEAETPSDHKVLELSI